MFTCCVLSCGCEVEICQRKREADSIWCSQFLQKLNWRLFTESWRIYWSNFEADWSSNRGDRPFLLFGAWKFSTFSTVDHEQRIVEGHKVPGNYDSFILLDFDLLRLSALTRNFGLLWWLGSSAFGRISFSKNNWSAHLLDTLQEEWRKNTICSLARISFH